MEEMHLRLDGIVRRIVTAADPLRVIVFGSGARGQMGPDSDLDLLIVMPDGTQRRRTAQRLYRSNAVTIRCPIPEEAVTPEEYHAAMPSAESVFAWVEQRMQHTPDDEPAG